MADELDPLASIVDHCRYSSSQEELLSHSKFAREDEIFAGEEARKSTAEVGSGGSRVELNVADDVSGGHSGEFFAVCADCEAKQELGFPGERRRSDSEVVYDDEVRFSELSYVELERFRVRKGGTSCIGKSIEPPAKKSRGSGLESPNLKDGKFSPQVMVFSGNVKVEIVSPLRYVEVRRDDLVKKKLEFGLDKQIRVEEEEGNEAKNKKTDHVDKEDSNEKRGAIVNGDNTDGSAKLKDAEDQGDGTNQGIERQGKRALPSSLLGEVWGKVADGGEAARNGVTESEGGINEATAEVNENDKFKVDGTMKHFFDVLRLLTIGKSCDDNEIDIFETAKRRGMTFPRSRFQLGEA